MRKGIKVLLVVGVLASLALGGITWAETQSLKDVADDHWAAAAIKSMADKGILKGYADETFRPDDKVSRAEVAQVVSNYQGWREMKRRPDHVNRGCPACHREVAPGRDHRLGVAASKIEGHPAVDATATVDDCLACHKPGGDAKLALRDIVHPLHFNSPIFTERYFGNCFTCHNVSLEGKFIVLKEKLEVDERGIPESTPPQQ